jgi:hypothetical protein
VTIVVFLGPSLPAEEALAILPDAQVMPPAGQGDVYRALANASPDAIGIVDGVFHQQPSVWHREILFALSRGVPVFGGASMGALRAAELADFGMTGVGRIFEAYRTGRFEPYAEPFDSDDEVAVLHGPQELGWPALSDALVDMRAACAEAAAAGVVSPGTRDVLVALARGTHFAERSLAALPAAGLAAGLPGSEMESLDPWLAGRTGLKARDAAAVLAALRAWRGSGSIPHQPGFVFEEPSAWLTFVAAEQRRREGRLTDDERTALEAARRDAAAWDALRARALVRLAARRGAGAGDHVALADLRRALDGWRVHRGLVGRAALESWLAENALDEDGLVRLMEDEVRHQAHGADVVAVRQAILDEMRLGGRFAADLATGRDLRRRAAVVPGHDRPPHGLAASLLVDRFDGGGGLSGRSAEAERIRLAFDSGADLVAWLWLRQCAGDVS